MRAHTAKAILQTCCGISRRVDRTTYTITGIVLTLVKYGVEVATFWLLAGVLLAPWDFVNPLMGAREAILRPAPAWLPAMFYVWTLQFLWISVSMSVCFGARIGRARCVSSQGSAAAPTLASSVR